MDALEWQVSEGLLVTLFSLSQAYLNRGSAREAEYFAQQAQDLAESLNAPTMVTRALAKKGEIQLYQGQLEASRESLTKASVLLRNVPGIDNADVRRLRGVYNERTAQPVDASELYEETINMIEELDQAFKNFDGLAFGCVFFAWHCWTPVLTFISRKSIGTSPQSKPTREIILSELLAAVLRQRSAYFLFYPHSGFILAKAIASVWLLRDNVEDYTGFLDRFLSLPPSSRTKVGCLQSF